MTLRVVSVNVGLPRAIEHDGQRAESGIVKSAVDGRVMVRATNLDGDRQADLRVHGGPDKAVYLYPHEHYARWRVELGRDDLQPGHFGENLTIEGLLEDDVFVGDVHAIGGARLQVCQPRLPCYKLGMRMGDMTFLKTFLLSTRLGWYARVLQEGEVGAGDLIEVVERDPGGVTPNDVARLRFSPDADAGAIERVLAVDALAAEWRGEFDDRLARLRAAGA